MTTLTRRSLVFVAMMATALISGCVSTGVTPEVRQALAPTGELRVGVYPGSPTSMIRDPATGEVKGVSIDLGKELAARLEVPFKIVQFERVAQVVEALRMGVVDFTVTNATEARAKDMDFSAPILAIEQGYMVVSGSPVSTLAEVDRPGVRVGVTQGSSSQSVLSSQFQHATLVTAPSLAAAVELLSSRKVDAYATNKSVLFELSDQLPGSRVLDGRWGLERMALAIPKGRDNGLAYIRKFAEEARSAGLVKQAADKAGVRGTANTE